LAEAIHSCADVTGDGTVSVADFELFCTGMPKEYKFPRKWSNAFPDPLPAVGKVVRSRIERRIWACRFPYQRRTQQLKNPQKHYAPRRSSVELPWRVDEMFNEESFVVFGRVAATALLYGMA